MKAYPADPGFWDSEEDHLWSLRRGKIGVPRRRGVDGHCPRTRQVPYLLTLMIADIGHVDPTSRRVLNCTHLKEKKQAIEVREGGIS